MALLVIALSSCGYHLRGENGDAELSESIAVQWGGNQDRAFEQRLMALIASRGGVVDQNAATNATIMLSPIEHDIMTIAEDGGPSLTRLTRTAKVSFAKQGQEDKVFNVAASADVSFNPNQVLSDQLEKAEYKTVIDTELANRIVTQLVYQLK